MGSPEQLAMKEYLLKKNQTEGKLSSKETDIFYETLTQEQLNLKRNNSQNIKHLTSILN